MWFGLGKRRTKLGRWLDQNGVSQEDLVRISGVSRATIGRLCNDASYEPTLRTAVKIVRALRRYDNKLSVEDFWDIED